MSKLKLPNFLRYSEKNTVTDREQLKVRRNQIHPDKSRQSCTEIEIFPEEAVDDRGNELTVNKVTFIQKSI